MITIESGGFFFFYFWSFCVIYSYKDSEIHVSDCSTPVLVMKDGNIIEQGTHEELLAKGGFYNKLYNSQFAKQ